MGVARALAAAFYDDPPTSWVLRDDATRLRLLERGFGLFLRRVWLAHDECYTTDALSGAAVWVPPEKWKLGPLAELALLPSMALLYGRLLPRVLRALGELEANHPSERHCYLPYVGVVPDAQGRGLGTALIAPVLERCDREDLPAYLEASTPRNRALYERLGFEVTEQLHLLGGGPPLWRMWRRPSRGGIREAGERAALAGQAAGTPAAVE